MKITQIILVDDSGKKYEINLPKHHNVAIAANVRQIPIFINYDKTPYDIITDNVFTIISSPETVPMDKISKAIQKIINK